MFPKEELERHVNRLMNGLGYFFFAFMVVLTAFTVLLVSVGPMVLAYLYSFYWTILYIPIILVAAYFTGED